MICARAFNYQNESEQTGEGVGALRHKMVDGRAGQLTGSVLVPQKQVDD